MKTPHKKNNRSAFTMAELLIAMPVMAMLMVSMGAAINGAMNNYEENSQAYSLNQSVHIIGERMAREIRSADNAACSMNLLNLDMPGDTDQVLYFLEGDTLFHVQIDGGQQTVSTLLGPTDGLSVKAFNIDMTMRDIEGTDYAVLINVTIDLLVDGKTKSYTISASLRKNQEDF